MQVNRWSPRRYDDCDVVHDDPDTSLPPSRGVLVPMLRDRQAGQACNFDIVPLIAGVV